MWKNVKASIVYKVNRSLVKDTAYLSRSNSLNNKNLFEIHFDIQKLG